MLGVLFMAFLPLISSTVGAHRRAGVGGVFCRSSIAGVGHLHYSGEVMVPLAF